MVFKKQIIKNRMIRLNEMPKIAVEVTNPVETPTFLREWSLANKKLGSKEGTA